MVEPRNDVSVTGSRDSSGKVGPVDHSARSSVLRLARSQTVVLIAVVAVLFASVPTTKPAAAASSCERRNNHVYRQLLECVSLAGVREHIAAFQAIADASGGNRANGWVRIDGRGYEASVAYVADRLEAAGWEVSLEELHFPNVGAVVLEQLTPVTGDYDTMGFLGGPAGEVTGRVFPVDLSLEPPRASTSACESADFADLDFSGSADIALIQRTTACTARMQVGNAEAAGAEAVIIFNEGNTPAREGFFYGGLGAVRVVVGVPVVSASFAAGQALAQAGTTPRILVADVTTSNVVAELPGRNDDNVVMAGAHLDSIPPSPGINNNGSGAAALLEVAENLGDGLRPPNTVRLVWWGASENGQVGSRRYLEELSQEEVDRIALYLNFDMLASPNYAFFVHDADESRFPASPGFVIPQGSTDIEDTLEIFYTWRGLPYDDAPLDAFSDHRPFLARGIPAGGLFTGAWPEKTSAQQAVWGGTAGEPYDPCYYEPCDTLENISWEALEVNADAVAFALLTYAYSTEGVNGVRGRPVPGTAFDLPAPAGPQGLVEEDPS